MTISDLTYRPFTSAEADQAMDLLGIVFGERFDDDDRSAERSIQDFSRSIGVFDDDRLVACLGDYAHDLSVPGGTLATAGTTWIGVLPTHRRRGIMRQMMTRHLAAAADRGEALAALWASEATIYGRFGYGQAIDVQRVQLELGRTPMWLPTAPTAPDVRLVSLDDAAKVLNPIYETCRTRRAGMHERTPDWWRFQALNIRTSAMGGAVSKLVAVGSVDGEDTSYAVYGTGEEQADGARSRPAVKVIEVAGVDAAAEGGMWRYLASHDLTKLVVAPRRPVDEILPFMLADSRRLTRRQHDGLHVRIVDLDAAVRGRTYVDSVGLTVRVHDDMLSGNDDTWRIEVAPEGVSLERVAEREVDLEMDIRAFATIYMGDKPIRPLVAAGMIDVHNPAVLHSMDTAFRSVEAGWSPEVW